MPNGKTYKVRGAFKRKTITPTINQIGFFRLSRGSGSIVHWLGSSGTTQSSATENLAALKLAGAQKLLAGGTRRSGDVRRRMPSALDRITNVPSQLICNEEGAVDCARTVSIFGRHRRKQDPNLIRLNQCARKTAMSVQVRVRQFGCSGQMAIEMRRSRETSPRVGGKGRMPRGMFGPQGGSARRGERPVSLAERNFL